MCIRDSQRIDSSKSSKKSLCNSARNGNCHQYLGKDFLMMNDPEKELVCLSTMTNLKILCEMPKLYVDGTFKSCPKFFKQIFTIHEYVKGMYVPLVFFSLSDKDSCTYTEMFKSTVAKCESHNLSLDPVEMFMDFESAISTWCCKSCLAFNDCLLYTSRCV